jgi:hypothetical protein
MLTAPAPVAELARYATNPFSRSRMKSKIKTAAAIASLLSGSLCADDSNEKLFPGVWTPPKKQEKFVAMPDWAPVPITIEPSTAWAPVPFQLADKNRMGRFSSFSLGWVANKRIKAEHLELLWDKGPLTEAVSTAIGQVAIETSEGRRLLTTGKVAFVSDAELELPVEQQELASVQPERWGPWRSTTARFKLDPSTKASKADGPISPAELKVGELVTVATELDNDRVIAVARGPMHLNAKGSASPQWLQSMGLTPKPEFQERGVRK